MSLRCLVGRFDQELLVESVLLLVCSLRRDSEPIVAKRVSPGVASWDGLE